MTASCLPRQAVVLIGGLGSRLGALTAAVPKPLLACGDRPFLAWILRELCRFGIEQVLLLASYRSEVVEQALPAMIAALPKPMDVVLVQEEQRTGTGGALHHARDRLADNFLLLNGDSWLDCNLSRLFADRARDPAGILGRMVVRQLEDTSRYGVAEIRDGLVTGFRERGAVGAPGAVNAGIYMLSRAVLEDVRPECSLERDVLPVLAARGQLTASVAGGFFIDIGVPDDLARAQAALPARLKRRALFLDRDGVINVDHGWVGTRERFEFTPDAIAAIRTASDAGWHVFVVTNQSGIARGHYSEAQFHELWGWLRDLVAREGGTLDDVRYCPDHPEAVLERYRAVSAWRKPEPGMLLDLIERWELDPARCHLVGDQPSDLQAAAAAGVPATLYFGGSLDACVRPIVGAPADMT